MKKYYFVKSEVLKTCILGENRMNRMIASIAIHALNIIYVRFRYSIIVSAWVSIPMMNQERKLV